MATLNRYETNLPRSDHHFGLKVGGGGITETPELPLLDNEQVRNRLTAENVGDMATGAAVSIGEQSTGVHQPPHPRVGGDSRVAEFVN